MARNLPARANGGKTVVNGTTGRDAHTGRFLPGNAGGGRPAHANMFARAQAELRAALLAEVSPADVRTILRQVIRIAKRGHLPAVELLLRWTMGAPAPVVDPDRLAQHELSVRQGMPTMIDELALAAPQADREPDDLSTDEPAEDPRAPVGPPLQQVLSWALEELAAAQTALRTQRPLPPPDPAVAWERFLEQRVEFDAQAAVEVDQLYVAYAKWCAGHGALALEEAKVLTALQAHGATLRPGAMHHGPLIVGVRVVA